MNLDELKAKAQGYASGYLDENGIQVHLQTDFWKSIKIYDSDAPASNGGPLPIKYSVAITNRSGKVIKQYNDTPAVSPVKSAAIIAIAGAGIFFLLSGVYTTIKKVIA